MTIKCLLTVGITLLAAASFATLGYFAGAYGAILGGFVILLIVTCLWGVFSFSTFKYLLSDGITGLVTAPINAIRYFTGTKGVVLAGLTFAVVVCCFGYFSFSSIKCIWSDGIPTLASASFASIGCIAGKDGALSGGVIGAGIGMIFAAFQIWELSDALEHDQSFDRATAFLYKGDQYAKFKEILSFIHHATARCVVSTGIITVVAGLTTIGYFAAGAVGAVLGGMFGVGLGLVCAVRLMIDTGNFYQIGRQLVRNS